MSEDLLSFCQLNNRMDLIEQWDADQNYPMTPESVSVGAKRRVWWRDSFDHIWQQSVYSRTARKYGCPICAGRQVQAGFNDLATTHPMLAAQWHPVNNGGLLPQYVTAGSEKKVWWICEREHAWQATIASRVAGCGCPVCSNRVALRGFNDLATVHPALEKEWDYEKNEPLKPQDVTPGYGKKVWWKCSKGHEWRAAPRIRIKSSCGCPVCSNRVATQGFNDLKSLFPAIASQWHPTRNAGLTPGEVVYGSNKIVWWLCPMGHEWRSKIADRTGRGNGCPFCAGQKVLKGFNDLASQYPELAKQWHPVMNGTLTPQAITSGSNRRVWWICSEGHAWRTSVCNRTDEKKLTGCPICSGHISEKKLLYYQRLSQQLTDIRAGEDMTT